MSLQPGLKIGPYEIVSALGAGGMGEVYRGRDARLARDVAIKVLPEHLLTDTQALARFEKEVRAVAALSHPNILGIFDFGQSGSIVYAVMELLDGETLREKMSRGELSTRRSIELAIQICRGLAAAHLKGIVHRDLKPENIFVTRDGQAKILDFGLAKRAIANKEIGTNASTDLKQTSPGTILGTVTYMSPEQARGQETDWRTDIFSFGSVLYEMITGKAAFRKETTSDTMSAILRDEPPELVAPTKPLPAVLERILRHCLEKDPERRFGSAADIAFDLEALSQPSVSTVAHKPVSAASWKTPVALLLLGALVAAAYFLGKQNVSAQQPAYERLTFSRGTVHGARFTADGSSIVYGAAWNGNPYEIFSTRSGSIGSTPIGVSDAAVFSVSSSGALAIGLRPQALTSLYSFYTLAQVSINGGVPRELLESVVSADWSPRGDGLAVGHLVDGKLQLEYPIGKVLYKPPGWISHIDVSPDGKRIAFLNHPFNSDGGSVSVVDLAGQMRDLTSNWISLQGLVWNPNGKEVWFTGTRVGAATNVHAVTLDGKERLVLPSPAQLTIWDISKDGRVLLTQVDWRGHMVFVAPGSDSPLDISNHDYGLIRELTPDGKMLSFDESGEAGGEGGEIYVRRLNDSAAIHLGTGLAGGFSPDQKWVATGDVSGTELNLLPIGAGQAQTISCNKSECSYPRFFPDGKRLLYYGSNPGHGLQLFVRSVSADDATPITPEGITFSTTNPISPDGKYVAAFSVDAKPTIYPVQGGEWWIIPGTEVRESPLQWTSDGKQVYLIRTSGATAYVDLVDVKTGERTLWKEIHAPDPAGVRGVTRVFPTPDGSAYAYNYSRILSTLFLVSGLQ